MTDPFRIEGPATISFSGGRTSAMMLYRIQQAHGGAIPADVHVVFANTGKERPETLTFVQEFASRWGIDIVWVEWREGGECFEIVGPNSCSRDGEPFEALIKKKQRLPNWMERWCTGILKVATMHAYLKSLGLELGAFAEVIGLRDDEGHRILQGEKRAETDGRRVLYPLAEAGITKPDVMAFWAAQEFDLALEGWEGNCDFCFLKGRGIRKRIIRDTPWVPAWWDRMEKLFDGFFDRRDRVVGLVREVRESPMFEIFEDDTAEYDAECGDMCGGDTPDDILILQRLYQKRKAERAS